MGWILSILIVSAASCRFCSIVDTPLANQIHAFPRLSCHKVTKPSARKKSRRRRENTRCLRHAYGVAHALYRGAVPNTTRTLGYVYVAAHTLCCGSVTSTSHVQIAKSTTQGYKRSLHGLLLPPKKRLIALTTDYTSENRNIFCEPSYRLPGCLHSSSIPQQSNSNRRNRVQESSIFTDTQTPARSSKYTHAEAALRMMQQQSCPCRFHLLFFGLFFNIIHLLIAQTRT